ncbi:hypothetical protein ABT404_54365, partial [Streptomyces hyaluromycini]
MTRISRTRSGIRSKRRGSGLAALAASAAVIAGGIILPASAAMAAPMPAAHVVSFVQGGGAGGQWLGIYPKEYKLFYNKDT